MRPIALGFVLVVVSGGAMAQPIAGLGRPDPLDAGAPVLPAVHDSPFALYRAFAAEEVAPWRGVNDMVGRIGGWKVYAREAYEATKPDETATRDAGNPAAAAAPTDPGARKGK